MLRDHGEGIFRKKTLENTTGSIYRGFVYPPKQASHFPYNC
jgi:hypothetical protein